MSKYPQVRFLKSADSAAAFGDDSGAEVAFAGRSNSGKSSALNAIVRRNDLARTSRTPGRTQLVNLVITQVTYRDDHCHRDHKHHESRELRSRHGKDQRQQTK